MGNITKIAAATLGLAAALSASAGEVEVLHYWTSGGEAKSAAELKKIMQAKGHTSVSYTHLTLPTSDLV